MSDEYQRLTVSALRKKLITLNTEFVDKLEAGEDWDQLADLRNEIRKVIQIIDLKTNKY